MALLLLVCNNLQQEKPEQQLLDLYIRMVLYLELIRVPLLVLPLQIKIVKRSTTLHPISTVAELEQPQTLNTAQVYKFHQIFTHCNLALISSQLEIHKLSTGREPRVVTAKTMLQQMLFKYQGQIGAALILGGVDINGSHLYTIHPHGSTDKLPYVTMGSGSLAAMAVFEAGYKTGMTREEGIALVQAAIEAGIFNDLGSGSNVYVVTITKGKTEILRNYVKPNPRQFRREVGYNFPRGTTPIVGSYVTAVEVTPGDAMEL